MEKPETREQFLDYVKAVCSRAEEIKDKKLDIVKVILGGNIKDDGSTICSNQEFIDVLEQAGISNIKPETIAVFAKAGAIDENFMESISPEANEMLAEMQAEQKAKEIVKDNKKLTNEELAEFQKQTTQQENSSDMVKEAKEKVQKDSKEHKKEDMQIITNSDSNKQNLERYLLEASTSQNGMPIDLKDIKDNILMGMHEGYFTIAVVDDIFQKYPEFSAFEQIKNDLTSMGYYKFYEKDDKAPTTSTGIKRLANLCYSLSASDSPEYIEDNMKNRVDACINYVDNGLVTLDEIKDLYERGILTEKAYEDVVTANKTDEPVSEEEQEKVIENENLEGIEPSEDKSETSFDSSPVKLETEKANNANIMEECVKMADAFRTGIMVGTAIMEGESVMKMVNKVRETRK